jgi:hypothetical protein
MSEASASIYQYDRHDPLDYMLKDAHNKETKAERQKRLVEERRARLLAQEIDAELASDGQARAEQAANGTSLLVLGMSSFLLAGADAEYHFQAHPAVAKVHFRSKYS